MRGQVGMAALAGALVLAACGSDDENVAAPDTEATAPAATSGAADTPLPDGDFCSALAGYAQSDDSEAGPDIVELERLASIAPGEIAGDLQDLAELSGQLVAFDEFTASEQDIEEFETAIAEFEPVALRLQAWSAENCPGVDLG